MDKSGGRWNREAETKTEIDQMEKERQGEKGDAVRIGVVCEVSRKDISQ